MGATKIIQRISTDDFLNTQVKDFAKYVIETRALPSIMDGLRIGARKIVYAAMTGTIKNGKKAKLTSLLGDSMKLEYLHGDKSLKGTSEQLGAEHVLKFPPLEIIGQTPSLRNNEVDTAARYLSVKISQNLDIYKTDESLWKLTKDEGNENEPECFYPIIPLILLNTTNSPGFGFSYRTFQHNINDIINAVVRYLINGSSNDDTLSLTNTLRPEIKGIKDKNFLYNGNKNCYYNIGEYEINFDKDTVIIKDLPYNVIHRKYIEHLQSLKDRFYILDFEDYTTKGEFDIRIKFPYGKLKKRFEDDKFNFFKSLKLFTKVPDLQLNTIDLNGNILFSETPFDLIDNFCKRRLDIYAIRKKKLVQQLKDKITELEDLVKFIELVINEKLIIFKRPISDVKQDMLKLGLTFNGLKLNVQKLTKEEIQKLMDELDDTKELLEYTQKTSETDMYLKELFEFREKYVNSIKKIKS
jgi:putative DNA topoisomerase 2, mitochondrial